MRGIIHSIRKCVDLVGRENIVPALGILLGSLAASAFEILGLSMILGVLTVLVADGEAAAQLPQIVPIDLLKSMPLGAVMGGILAAYVMKSASVLAIRWLTARYSSFSEARFATKVLAAHMRATYAESTRFNSAHVMQKVEQQTSAVFSGTLLSTLTLLSNAILLAGISALLLLIDPVMTGMGLLFFTVITPVYLKLSSPVTHRLGHRAGALGKAYTQLMQEALHALKELHVTNTISFFLRGFDQRRMEYARVRAHKTFITALSPVLLELMAVLAALLLFYSLIQLRGGQGSIVLMGTFAAALSRIIGYVNGIVTSLNALSFARPAVDELHADMRRLLPLSKAETHATERMPFADRLAVTGATYSHTGDGRAHLDNVSVDVPFGTVVALVGQSGAGKSTLVDIMVGLLEPDNGTVSVDGRPIADDPASWQAAIGYVSQNFYLIDDTIRRNVALGLPDADIDDDLVRQALRDAGMGAFLASQADGLDTRVGDRGQKLSGGQRQRIAIARALYRTPSLLILDEATSALDPTTESRILDEIQSLRSRMGIVLITHRLAAAARCDHVYYLRDGHVVHHGSFDQVKAAAHAQGDDFFAKAFH